MRRFSQRPLSAALAVALLSPAVISGCSARVAVGYRVYDPGYGDYHVWDANEAAYYSRWEGETHRTPTSESAQLRNRKSILRGGTTNIRKERPEQRVDALG